ncbi:axonemal dynein light chain domain-containing protein 1-like isoform X2 [Dysidea avara]|uniref:axonemal dynein light chain domain-containing protein 1-like isoform X2 n=1 Tax=Dysidea avara TaxID=196820 RepID=UPI00332D40C7
MSSATDSIVPVAGTVKAAGSGCLLPFIEGTKKDATATTKGVPNDFIPSDLLLSLKRFTGSDLSTPPKGATALPPSRKNPTLPPTNTSPMPVRRPANMWNFPNRRRKFKHLTGNTPCICGAGKDISFLYDIQGEEDDDVASKDDNSTLAQSIPASLIPEEYHIVKHPGVIGLEFHDDSYSSRPADHDHHMTVFPSMKPSGRHEVVALKHTMDAMLEKAGIGKMASDEELSGPTSMHNLLQLVQKEQDIYNIIFHELIRQVSVHCVERGGLLSELRTRYSNLLDRIPRQVKDLHNEVTAQRALDRRLTSELKKFKTTITSLTRELADVKEHDMAITEMADTAQEELATALADSQRSSRTLTEYHELYELQRKRLESQVATLNQERNVWQQTAYDLAYRVAEEHNLHSVRKLQLYEKSWVKLSTHFSLVLSSKETHQLNELQYSVMLWRDDIIKFSTELVDLESTIRNKLMIIRQKLQGWIAEFETMMDEETGIFTAPDDKVVFQLWKDIQGFQETFSKEGEHFAGEVLLSKQETIKSLAELVERWTDTAIKMFSRHRIDSNAEEFEMMQNVNANIDELLAEYGVRVSGENGIATSFLHLLTPMETWDTKLNAVLNSGKTLPNSDWLKLHVLMEEWLDKVEDTIGLIGKPTPSSMSISSITSTALPVEQLTKDVDKWKNTLTNSIDSQNAKIAEQVLQTHMSLVQWMSNVLLRLSHAKHVDQGVEEDGEEDKMKLSDYVTECDALTSSMEKFTKHLISCCEDVVPPTEDTSEEESTTGEPQNELKRMMSECEQWIKMAKLLLQELGAVDINVNKQASPTTAASKQDSGSAAGQKDDDNATTTNNETTEQKPPDDSSSTRDNVQVLGEDENVRAKPMEEMITKTSSDIAAVASTAKLELVEENEIPAHSPVLQVDAEKLVMQVDQLEATVKQQEKRVHDAEEQAKESKQQLMLATDRISELENELAELKRSAEKDGRSSTSGKTKKSAVRRTTKQNESPLKKR